MRFAFAGTSSSARNVRPIAACASSASKNAGETKKPRTRSG